MTVETQSRFHPNESRRRGAFLWAGLAVILGGILQGVGANIQRYTSSELAWGSVGVLVGGALSVWFARRLRWWLAIYIPLIWLAMAGIAMPAEVATGGIVSRAAYESGECGGWQGLNADLAPISKSMATFATEFNTNGQPSAQELGRWSSAADAIQQQYEDLHVPPVLNHYRDLSVRGMSEYEQGFSELASGRDGNALLQKGDQTLSQARASFRDAAARCLS